MPGQLFDDAREDAVHTTASLQACGENNFAPANPRNNEKGRGPKGSRPLLLLPSTMRLLLQLSHRIRLLLFLQHDAGFTSISRICLSFTSLRLENRRPRKGTFDKAGTPASTSFSPASVSPPNRTVP